MARIAAWRLAPYAARFRRPVVTAHGTWEVREGLYVAALGAGLAGLGEAAPLPAWGTESLEAARAVLGALGPLDVASLDELPAALAAAGLDRVATPAAYAAAEQAVLDVLARERAIPLAELLAGVRSLVTAGGTSPEPRTVRVNALMASRTPDDAAAEARGLVAAGFTTLKLKIDRDVENARARLAAVRAAVGPDVALRLDANGAWTREEARDALKRFAPYGPAYVEQPTDPRDPAALAELGLPVAADEAAHFPGGLEEALEAGVAAVVLKPVALGGLLATQRAIARARAHGALPVLASAMDRGVSLAGALHLAAATPDLPAAGLATADLFEDGPALAGLAPVRGAIALLPAPGLGFSPLDPILRGLVA